MKKKKFTVIVSHPIQYHAVLWRNMAKLTEVDFEVFFCSDHGQNISLDKEFGIAFKWDVSLKNGYKSRTFGNFGFGEGFFKYINPNLLIQLLLKKTDYIYFHGVNNFTAYFAFWISKLRGSTTIIRNIAHLLDENSTAGTRFQLKNLIFGTVFRRASFCLYIGFHNKEFYRKFGVKETKLIHAPHVVDNGFFQERILTNSQKIGFKHKLNIDEDCFVILFCGKLIPKKQPIMLLDAFIGCQLVNKSMLIFVGEGELRAELEQKASSLYSDKMKSVQFLGFKNQSELPSIYSISDLLVLPSFHQETWGLVVNEALNFSTSIIVSDNVGCGPELVEGKTGFVFNRNSTAELKMYLEKLLNNKELLESCKTNSTEIINKWSVQEYIESIKNIINE